MVGLLVDDGMGSIACQLFDIFDQRVVTHKSCITLLNLSLFASNILVHLIGSLQPL
jgi:hypothetical protein